MKQPVIITCIILSLLWTSFSCSSTKNTGTTTAGQPFTADSILHIMHRTANWQIDSIRRNGWRHQPREWTSGALFTGLTAYAAIAKDSACYAFLKEEAGEKYDWQLQQGKARYFADNYCVGQLYCQLYQLYKDPRMIADLRKLADTLIARPHTEPLEWKNSIQLREWAWCDALFMGPPSLAMLAKVTGERKYLDLADSLWWKTTAYLYDPAEQLYFRDGSYLHKKEQNGQKVFWSRGNGWVLAGLVRVLENMPGNYPSRSRWVKLYRDMAARIASLQQPDGTWYASLLDPAAYPVKETSGTGFFTYALAWGINHGLLEKERYAPVVWKSWAALVQCVHPGGMLGFVQRIGGAPDKVTADDTELYGVGAFLLSGSELLRMVKGEARLMNKEDDGYRSIWYSIGQTNNEYVYKYSGGMGTYPANHYPFSVYAPAVDKTFFCYGGTDEGNTTLYHEVAFFDHKTGMVSRPTIVMDKATGDAHDNPVIQVDKKGYIWLFSTSHGTSRPSFIHRSAQPYDISKFERVNATKTEKGQVVPMNNFSYVQMYYDREKGFLALFTHYEVRQLAYGKKSCRIIAYMTSADGIHWSEWKDLAGILEGHYQTSGQKGRLVGTSFNHHPNVKKGAGLDYRTSLYYVYTDDFGKSWKTANGSPAHLPYTNPGGEALVHDYAAEGLNVYINDLNFDHEDHPVILYETSKGPEPGPQQGPHQWYTARWTGKEWKILPVTTSDHNYDMGSLYMEKDNSWRIIAPTVNGPQAYNTGGEMTMLISHDQGASWTQLKQLTKNSRYNHSYARRPVNAQPGFYALWADGDGRKPSVSHLYFTDSSGRTFMLPDKMPQQYGRPLPQ